MVNFRYLNFLGYRQIGSSERNNFENFYEYGFTAAGALLGNLIIPIENLGFIGLQYHPIMIEVGTYGVGIGYHRFGIAIQIRI